MAEIAKELRDLEAAKLRIAEGERLVAEQAQRLEVLWKDGHSTQEAEKTLARLRGALQARRDTQAIIERILQDIEAGRLP